MKPVFSSVFEADFSDIVAHFASDVTAGLSIRFERSVVANFGRIMERPEIGRRRMDLAHREIRSLTVNGFENYTTPKALNQSAQR